MPVTSEQATTGLRRELGRWDLTAIGVNQVIGGGIFLIPAAIASEVGAWGPIAFVLVGLSSLLVALCFAEVGSRFDSTGGPYLYTRAAFGRLAGFEVGWMQWFTRVTSQASNANGIALALGIAAYALSPIDLIPDFIPVLGYLDDLVLLPPAILLVVWMIPDEVMAEHRAAAEMAGTRPVSRVGAAIIIGAWVLLAIAAGVLLHRFLTPSQ